MNTTRRFGLVAVLLASFAVCALAPAQDTDADAARNQTLKLFKTFKDRDWKSLYDIISLPSVPANSPEARDVFAQEFDKGLKDGDPDDDFSKLMDGMADVNVGTAVIEKDTAYVATTCTVSIDSQKVRFVGLAKLVKVDGDWKWDLTFTDSPDKAAEQRFTELIGVPSKE